MAAYKEKVEYRTQVNTNTGETRVLKKTTFYRSDGTKSSFEIEVSRRPKSKWVDKD